jgi:integrase
MGDTKRALKEKNRPWRTDCGIRIRPLRGKRDPLTKEYSYTYRVEVPGSITGRRKLKIFKTPAEAEAYASLMHVQRQNHGLSAFALTDAQRADAKQAFEVLSAFPQVTLTEVAQFYRKHFMPEGGDVTVKQLVDLYLDEKEKEKLKERSIRDLQHRLNRFVSAFGGGLVKEIGGPELRQWLFEDPTLQDQTKKNYRTVLHGLFNFAESRKFAVLNPTKSLPRIKIDKAEPGVLSLGQIQALLHAALERPELELGAYLTLGLFCGVRASELEKLTWHEVRVAEHFVTIPPKIAKKRRIRNIPLEPCALAWLGRFGLRASGQLAPTGLAKRLRKLRIHASILAPREGRAGQFAVEFFSPVTEWPDNALRHSFATYYYAWTGNAQETCARLGQKDDAVLFEHYRALARRDEGAAYFGLMPPPDESFLNLNSVMKPEAVSVAA